MIIAYILAGVVAGLVVSLASTLLWLHATITEGNHLRDLMTAATARETTHAENEAALEQDVARLTPALATTERLLIAANAKIAKLENVEVTEDKHEIDAIPDGDLVADSHKLLSPETPGTVAAARGDDPTDAVPRPDPASQR